MGFNFPDSPSIGQLHPASPQVGIPQYQWNGSEWVTPQYNPLTYVLKTGDTMTGALNVVTPPTLAAHAASKAYVDAYAAPFDAMAYSGMQINGSMEVSQEHGSTVIVNASAHYVIDGWLFYKNGTVVCNAGQYASGATLPGLPSYLGITVTTAQTSIGANDYIMVQSRIEGYRVARLAWGTASARPITIGFWTGHKRVGTYCVSVQNIVADRSYVATYTQNVSAVFEYKTVTIPGCPDGVWEKGNLAGMMLSFTLAAGTTYRAPAANSWRTGNFLSVAAQINGVAATTDVFALTGVVVLPGSYAPTAAQSPLIMRSADQELATYQRYWEKLTATAGEAYGAAGINMRQTAYFVYKRVVPTIAVVNPMTFFNCVNIAAYPLGEQSTQIVALVSASGEAFFNATLNIDARL